MENMNWWILLVAGLVPMIMGFIWYNPKILGTAWMKAADMNEDKMKGANMPVIFIVSYILSVMLAAAVMPIVIHQFGVISLTGGDPELIASQLVQDFLGEYGQSFRTFKHGAFHGTVLGIMFALPILGTNALFERKGGKYIFINVGYWTITLALMGGVICQWM